MKIVVSCIDCGKEKEVYVSDYKNNEEILCYECSRGRQLQAEYELRNRMGCGIGDCHTCNLTDCGQNEKPA